MSQDYNATLNLPKTDFPMRAGLPKSEPVTLKNWEEEQLYNKLMEVNEGKPLFVLHDGPPYANGNIHLGTALNKVLKDFIVRYKNMSGFKAPYVPGWDTHGLPTELKARKKAGVGSSADISELELRKMCREFVEGYIDDQRSQFKRLGCIAFHLRKVQGYRRPRKAFHSRSRPLKDLLCDLDDHHLDPARQRGDLRRSLL